MRHICRQTNSGVLVQWTRVVFMENELACADNIKHPALVLLLSGVAADPGDAWSRIANSELKLMKLPSLPSSTASTASSGRTVFPIK